MLSGLPALKPFQRPPFVASGGGSWSPDDEASLFAWWRGDTYVETSGKISQWTDKSGNARHLVQSDADYRPVASATGGPDSTSAINFEAYTVEEVTYGPYLYCESTEWDGPLEIPLSIVAVAKITTAGIANVLFDENEDDPPVLNLGGYGTFFLGDGTTNLYAGPLLDTAWHFFDFGVDDSTPLLRIDGSTESYSGTLNTSLQIHTLRVGDVRTGVGPYPWDGLISELMFFNEALDSTQRTNLEAYIAARYSL
jgi:hypothetical protein